MTAPSSFSKKPHARRCDGTLCCQMGKVYVDRVGRINNGGYVAHRYMCTNPHCDALVLVTEAAVRNLAIAAEQR